VLVDISICPVAASSVCSAARFPSQTASLCDADKWQDYTADHNCPGYAFREVSFTTLECFSPAAMHFLWEAIHAAFLYPGPQISACCFNNVYRMPSKVHCRYSSRMMTAARISFPSAMVLAVSRGWPNPHRRFCTRPWQVLPPLLRIHPSHHIIVSLAAPRFHVCAIREKRTSALGVYACAASLQGLDAKDNLLVISFLCALDKLLARKESIRVLWAFMSFITATACSGPFCMM
jgi:hypothetical protein